MATLVRAWILLVILTLAAMWAGAAQNLPFPALVQVGVIMMVSGLKASTILSYFLGLRSASAGWRMLFSIYLVVLGGAIIATYAIGCSLAPGRCAILPAGAIHD
jgi:heme/copper-type cytochrome/quinol oxidase subunit 4